jgi:hypothetical protein
MVVITLAVEAVVMETLLLLGQVVVVVVAHSLFPEMQMLEPLTLAEVAVGQVLVLLIHSQQAVVQEL